MAKKVTAQYLLKCLLDYLLGNIIGRLIYEKGIFASRYFKGRFGGITANGWRWVMDDIHGRVFMRSNRGVPFPVSPFNTVVNPSNIEFDYDDLHIFNGKGRFYQAENAKIIIGSGCYIANNVGIVTTEHDIMDPAKSGKSGDIILGRKCWIGMNSVITKGVILGDHTVVGAGSVVTKSFPSGYCILAGTPAQIIRELPFEDSMGGDKHE